MCPICAEPKAAAPTVAVCADVDCSVDWPTGKPAESQGEREWFLYRSVSDDVDTLTAVVRREGEDEYENMTRVVERSRLAKAEATIDRHIHEHNEAINNTIRMYEARIAELERENIDLLSVAGQEHMTRALAQSERRALTAENIRLREALEYYADDIYYHGPNSKGEPGKRITEGGYLLSVERDHGNIARTALASERGSSDRETSTKAPNGDERLGGR
jgi:hypothetical protein